MPPNDAEKRVSIRLAAEDLENVAVLKLGDETLSQTVRRVLREAAAKRKAKGRVQQ
jgi:hypothetical protein